MIRKSCRNIRNAAVFLAFMSGLMLILGFFLLAPAVGWFIGKRYYILLDGYEGWSPYGYNMHTGRDLAVVPVEVCFLIGYTYFAFFSGVQLEGVAAFLGSAILLTIWVIVLKRLVLSLDRYSAHKSARAH